MWNHGNADIFLCCKAQEASHLALQSDLFARFQVKTNDSMPCLSLLGFVYRAFSPGLTYLHNVIDQRITEHPVQVNALVLQNVLEKKEQINNCYRWFFSCNISSRMSNQAGKPQRLFWDEIKTTFWAHKATYMDIKSMQDIDK